MGKIMDTINYKQLAQNVFRLIESGYKTNAIEIYIKWEFGKKEVLFPWSSHKHYLELCEILHFLELPEPSEEEWKKR